MEKNTIIIDGVEYIKKDSVKVKAESLDGMPYVIVRTYSAGVFAGYLESRDGKEAVIRNVRRIWYWEGANSLSQLAVDGTLLPDKCKFAIEVDKITVTEAIEILDCTEKAMLSIQEVSEWVKK